MEQERDLIRFSAPLDACVPATHGNAPVAVVEAGGGATAGGSYLAMLDALLEEEWE